MIAKFKKSTYQPGIPAIIFGYPWYMGCEGIFRVSTVEEMQSIMSMIESGIDIDLEKVRLFIYAVEQVGIDAYIEGKWKHFFNRENDPIAMANAIHQYSERNQ